MIDPITGWDVHPHYLDILNNAGMRDAAQRINYFTVWGYHAPVAAAIPVEEDMSKLSNTFLMGCDPEFVVMKPPRLVMLQNHLPHGGEIGWDHNGRVGELRPQPTKNCLTLVKRLRTLLKTDNHVQALLTHKWRAGAIVKHDEGTETLGGHVHIDIPPIGDKADVVIPALDKITEWLEKLDILPMKESKSRRAGEHGYGRYGDVREHHGHMEYRTMASWLYDPRVAYLCLTAIKLAARFPKDTYRFLAAKTVSDGTFRDYLAKYAAVDDNAKQCADIVKDTIAISTDTNIQDSWETLPTF